MTRLLSRSLCLFSFCIGSLQASCPPGSEGSLSGQIIEAKTGTPLAFASVTVYRQGSDKALSGDISGAEGRFTLGGFHTGAYVLEVRFMGYQSKRKKFRISAENQHIDLGKITLMPDAQQLSDVNVTAARSTVVQKPDRKVIKVGKDLAAAGSNAADLMNNLPSVQVDPDGNLSLRGDENVKLFIDGKPSDLSPAQVLKQIPSQAIEKIELITNPSAKYNPEGTSGIINIVLKKNAQTGFHASLSQSYRYGKHPKYDGSLNSNYHTGPFNFFANGSYRRGTYASSGEVIRPDNGSTLRYKPLSKVQSYLLKTGFDLYLNDKNTFSAYTRQNFWKTHENNDIRVDYAKGTGHDTNQQTDTRADELSRAYDLDYKHEFAKKDHSLEYEVRYTQHEQGTHTAFGFSPAGGRRDYQDQLDKAYHSTIMNLDYSNPISEHAKLELGLESRARTNANHYRSSSENLKNLDYYYNRHIYSAYGNYKQRFDKLSLQLGLRLENFHVRARLGGDIVYQDDYTAPYPSAFISYEASEQNQYQLSYSRRVDRPGLSRVSPIREWSTPTLISVGNAALKPQFTHSIEWNYTHQLKRGSLTAGVFYRIINHPISRSVDADPLDPNRSILSYKNLGQRHAYGIEGAYNSRLKSWWHLNASVDLYAQKLSGVIGNTPLTVHATPWSLKMNNDFSLRKNLRLQLFTLYLRQGRSLQFESRPMFRMDTGLRYTFWHGKADFSLRLNDLFNSFHYRFDTELPYPQHGTSYWESRMLSASLTYAFSQGKTKMRKRRERAEENDQNSPI